MESNNPREEVLRVSDELRALADAGLHYARREQRPYDCERYEKALRLAARLLDLADDRGLTEIERVFTGDISHATPRVCAEGAVFDSSGRLLLTRRCDSGLWCIPGGVTDVGETAAECTERELREETGLDVRAVDLIAILDNRFIGRVVPMHAYHLTFACRWISGEPKVMPETTDVGWFSRDSLPALETDHVIKTQLAFAYHDGRLTRTHFDGRPAEEQARP